MWYSNERKNRQLENGQLLKASVVLAAITFITTLLIPVYGLVLMLLSPSNTDIEWILLNLSLQLFAFIVKPELILMVYLFRQNKGEDAASCKIRKTTKLYFALWIFMVIVMLIANLTDSGVASQWFGCNEGAQVEAGDLSEWSTEDDL